MTLDLDQDSRAFLDQRLQTVRTTYALELRPEHYVGDSAGLRRDIELAFCANALPWTRRDAEGHYAWQLRSDLGAVTVTCSADELGANLMFEAVVDLPGFSVEHAGVLRQLLGLNWRWSGTALSPRLQIDPNQGVGLVRACGATVVPYGDLAQLIAASLVELLDVVAEALDIAGGQAESLADGGQTATAIDDGAQEHADDTVPGLDDLLRAARQEHGDLLGAPSDRSGAPTQETFENALRSMRLPFQRSEQAGARQLSWELYTDAGGISAVEIDGFGVILDASVQTPASTKETRSLLAMNDFKSLVAGVAGGIDPESGRLSVRAVIDPHAISCSLNPSWHVERTLLCLLRMQARAASRVCSDESDDATTGAAERDAPPTLQQSLARLDGLVGLAPVKGKVRSVAHLLQVQQRRSELGLAGAKTSQHLVFTGPPGTGKTTVAALVGQIYRALGLLEKGHVVAVARQDLVAEYVGQTAVKTNKVIERAMGGVLFIDEAYTLSPEDPARDFGREAIDTLLARMENEREKFVVIVAGYPSEMRRFLNANPGLESRFPTTIEFPDYSPEELLQILDHFAGSYDYRLTPPATERAGQLIRQAWTRRTERFGNARMVRNLMEAAIHRHADRLMADGTLEGDDDALGVLDADDFTDDQA
jgi:AAA+ superfamily predicted ATPase